ncbi:MAG: thiazole synthase [Pseudoxanthomonas sp.]
MTKPTSSSSDVRAGQDPRVDGAGDATFVPADDDSFTLAGRTYRSRLLIGTGKFKDPEQTRQALAASGAEIVTVAVRRVELQPGKPSLLDAIDRTRYQLLPNTAGCYTAEEAIRTCRLARELGMSDMVKLEVIGDPRTLFPDVEQTLQAARVLVKEGFIVLPYITDDPVACQRLADIGCAAVMPLAAPIGSGLGIRNPYNLRLILEVAEAAKVPVIVDAGVGTASDAAEAMELGCHAVLMNTGVAGARDPIQMAHAMRLGIVAGRLAYRAGRIPRRLHANASSPQTGLISTLPTGPQDIE